MFGSAGCGKLIQSEHGSLFPLTCWEMYQNKYGGELDTQNEPNQLKAIRDIAAQAEGIEGRPPAEDWVNSVPHITASLKLSEQDGPGKKVLTAEETVWKHF